MKQKLISFFYGRNGMDTLANATIFPSLILLLVSGFVSAEWLRFILYFLSTVGLLYGYYRVFSRNLYKRQKENAEFKEFFKIMKLKYKDRKTYRYYRCRNCHAWMRVPKGMGSITITCRVCKIKFNKTT